MPGEAVPNPYFLQQAELLQLPLMVEDEAVAAGPPAGQVLLSPDVGHGGVQHTPATPLHACGDRRTAQGTDTGMGGGTWSSYHSPAAFEGRSRAPTWAAGIRHAAQAQLVDARHTVAESKREASPGCLLSPHPEDAPHMLLQSSSHPVGAGGIASPKILPPKHRGGCGYLSEARRLPLPKRLRMEREAGSLASRE